MLKEPMCINILKENMNVNIRSQHSSGIISAGTFLNKPNFRSFLCQNRNTIRTRTLWICHIAVQQLLPLNRSSKELLRFGFFSLSFVLVPSSIQLQPPRSPYHFLTATQIRLMCGVKTVALFQGCGQQFALSSIHLLIYLFI